jgi:hypothetical protein
MKAISLVFEYDFEKQINSGRTWGKIGYNTKDFIFEYSAASFATFSHHNNNNDFIHEITTDDEDLLRKKLSKYDVSWNHVIIKEEKQKIESWKNHKYCLYPAMMWLDEYKNEKSQLVRLDNDLECKKPLNDLFDSKEILIWKKERKVYEGKEKWGERLACRKAFGTEDFDEYNIGVLGFPSGDKENLISEITNAGLLLIEQDISEVVSFNERPDLKVKMLSWSDQTACSWILHKNQLKMKIVEDYINHHCYGFDSKKDCIKAAEFLLKV